MQTLLMSEPLRVHELVLEAMIGHSGSAGVQAQGCHVLLQLVSNGNQDPDVLDTSSNLVF